MVSPVGMFAEQAVDFIEQYFGWLLGAISEVLTWPLNLLEGVLCGMSPVLFMVILIAVSLLITRRLSTTLFAGISFCIIYWMGYWESAMITLSMVIISALVAITIGIPLGIWSAKSETANPVIKALMDFMQTMPAFVYLIPAVIFFGLGMVPGVVATVIFAMPPIVRLTNLGIRQVPAEMNEVADAFGSTGWQKLTKVQMPEATPSIMAGINQCIMLSLSMVVISAMIGCEGLGQDIVYALSRVDVALGFEAGLAVVLIAMVLDRLTQALNRNAGGMKRAEPAGRTKRRKVTAMKIGAVLAVLILLVAGAAAFHTDDGNNAGITKMGTVLDSGAQCGLAVPTYAAKEYGLEYISDLEEYADNFDYEIVGIDAGAGIMSSTENAINQYGLSSFKLVSSSESGMLTSLKNAYASEKAIVVTMWTPHWANGVYDLTFLKDPDLAYGEAESIESWGRPGLVSDDPVIAQVLSNYEYSTAEFNDLLSYIDSSGDTSAAVEQWTEAHQDLLAKWLAGTEYKAGRGEITIGLVNWADAIGSSNVLKYVIEKYVGYDVELTELNVGVMYQGLSDGEIDLITTAWLPITHAQYIEKYA